MAGGVSPTQAWSYAQQWRALALSQWGPDRERSLHNAVAWEHEYARLVGVPRQPQPVATARHSAASPPLELSHQDGHGWVAPGHRELPDARPAPLRGWPPYQGPGAQPVRGRGWGRVAMAAAVVVAMVVYLTAQVLPHARGRESTQVAAPPATLSAPQYIDADTTARGTAEHGQRAEADWKAGKGLTQVPTGVAQDPTVPFSNDYPDANAWLRSQDPAQRVNAVFTADPTYNCGIEKGDTSDAYVFAGCEDPQYGPVIFVYWGKNTTVAEREFVVAHELSHYYQWYYYYDVNASATAQGFDANSDWVRAVETDATCRVLSWGGYSAAVADESSSPCDAPDWQEGWLTTRAQALGIEITDY